MTQIHHKFQIGTIVRSAARQSTGIPPGSYEVVRQLPSDDGMGDPQYHVKATGDGHQRVIRESQLG